MSLAERWIPGGWTEREVALGGAKYTLLVPAAPDDVLYHLEAHPEEAKAIGDDPYWAQLWPTSLHLAESVLAADWPAGATAIELGCGVGVAGLAALIKGLHVTFSDYNPIAVDLAVENARRCGFTNVAGLALDWRNPLARKFDVILASDVIYDRQLHVPLMNTLEALAHEQSVVWIGDGGRSATEDFFYRASDRWPIELLDLAGRPASSLHIGEYRLMVCHPHSAPTRAGG